MKGTTKRKLLAAVAALVVYAALDSSIRDTEPWQATAAEPGSTDEALDQLAIGLFDTHVIAFEVLGVLLTAAMIGALVIARPLGQPGDDTHYPYVSDRELEETAHTSDIPSDADRKAEIVATSGAAASTMAMTDTEEE